MEELRKCYKKLDELMKEIENRHDTDIMDFINLDEEVKSEYMASTIRKAYRIVAEELHTGEFLPEIDQ